MTKELVVAAYDKPLDWLLNINNDVKISIYRKGNLSTVDNEIHIEPNVGRCVHSFFHHIYTNYNNLSDFTFFVQDFPFDHWGNLIEIINGPVEDISSKATLRINGYYGYHNNTLGTAWSMPKVKQFENGNALVCYSNGAPQDLNPNINVDSFWLELFEGQPPIEYEFMPGGHFVITKEQLQSRPQNFYKKIKTMLENNITAPWMIERLECYIFDTKYKIKIC
jgi:hypothetical protein